MPYSKTQNKQLRAMFAKHEMKKGLNTMTVQELKHSNNNYYVPPLYQVNVNGKGIQTPSNHELTMDHLKNFKGSIHSSNKRGHKIGS